MKIIFVRHSEPDYSMLDQHEEPWEYRGFGRDLAPLTQKGRKLAETVAKDPRLAQAQIVISSSITRALETATYIVRYQNKPLLVEPFFHEWRPNLDGLNYTEAELTLAYETAEQVRKRFLKALEKYRQYETVVIVCHGMLIRQFVCQERIAYCELMEIEL